MTGILDICKLISAALIVCALGVGAFVLADIRHVNPLWVFVAMVSIVFLVGAKEDYRRQFRSTPFLVFVGAWIVINAALVVTILGLFGWLYLIPVLLLEQILFYMTTYWLFGLRPPVRR